MERSLKIFGQWYKLNTYFCLPKIGESPIMTEAKADFTCWLASATSSLIHGRMLFIITCSWISVGRFWQKSEIKKIYKLSVVDKKRAKKPFIFHSPMKSTRKITGVWNIQYSRTLLIWTNWDQCLFGLSEILIKIEKKKKKM